MQGDVTRQSGGEGGIRTPGTSFSSYNGLANRRIQPLCHLSGDRFQLSIVLLGIVLRVCPVLSARHKRETWPSTETAVDGLKDRPAAPLTLPGFPGEALFCRNPQLRQNRFATESYEPQQKSSGKFLPSFGVGIWVIRLLLSVIAIAGS